MVVIPEPRMLSGGRRVQIEVLSSSLGPATEKSDRDKCRGRFLFLHCLFPSSAVPLGQLFFEVGDRAAGRFEQHQQVVYEVRRFVNHRLAVTRHGFDHGFDGLFADFLRDFVHAAVEQPAGVRSFGHLGVPAPNHALEVADEAFGFGRGPREAALGARVAGRAVGDDADQERVVVAVGRDRNDVEIVAAGLALGPETAPRAAVEGDAPFCEAFFVGFAVHVAEHQHLQGAVVLYDGGNQPVGLFCGVEFRKGFCFDFHGVYNLTLIFCRCSSRLSAGIGISL